ncbi:MAG: LysR family glycine cleavage system transcriptional activator [Candidatus Azotimanducaceae bacterium]
MSSLNLKSSLRGLRTFCVAARYRSFRLAAETLNVTPSAVSHQIKNLEAELDLSLFTRHSRHLELTLSGEQLYQELEQVIGQLDEITARFRMQNAKRQLRISAQPFFASEFFLPRLEQFTCNQPDLEIFVDTSDESSETHPTSADASIRLFKSTPRDLDSDALFPLRLMPACSPEFLNRFANDEEKLSRSFPIILHASRPEVWNQWVDSTGIKLAKPSRTISVDSMIAVARAAERGLGAALVPMPLSENWFRYGALVPLFEREITLEERYFFVAEPSRSKSEDVQALRQWVLETFADL